MDGPPFFLGIELMAHQLVLLLEDRFGQIKGQVARGFGKDEQMLHDPQDWWRALRTGTKDLLRRTGVANTDIHGIGLAGPDAGAVCLSAKGGILCQTSLGANDTLRPYGIALEEAVGQRNLLNLTGHFGCPDSLAAQLLWLKDQHKRIWHDLTHILLPRDFLRYRLTETMITDPSAVSHTLLFNPRNQLWSRQILDRLEFNPAWLPEIGRGPHISGRVTRTAAAESGLAEGTIVAVGGSRGASMAVATGAIASGNALVELGGDGLVAVFKHTLMRPRDRLLCPGCHCLDNLWSVCQRGLTSIRGFDWLTRLMSAGEISQWRRTGRDPLQVFAEFAAETSPGSDGMMVVPAIPALTPMHLLGINSGHQRGHLVRAMFEGSALSVRWLLDRFAGELPRIEDLRATGAGSGISLWCQILADATGRMVTHVNLPQPVAQGAAMLASIAVGCWPSVEQACAQRRVEAIRYQPRKAAQAVYEQMLAKFVGSAEWAHGVGPPAPSPSPSGDPD